MQPWTESGFRGKKEQVSNTGEMHLIYRCIWFKYNVEMQCEWCKTVLETLHKMPGKSRMTETGGKEKKKKSQNHIPVS